MENYRLEIRYSTLWGVRMKPNTWKLLFIRKLDQKTEVEGYNLLQLDHNLRPPETRTNVFSIS
jgi:hypothetical protein